MYVTLTVPVIKKLKYLTISTVTVLFRYCLGVLF